MRCPAHSASRASQSREGESVGESLPTRITAENPELVSDEHTRQSRAPSDPSPCDSSLHPSPNATLNRPRASGGSNAKTRSTPSDQRQLIALVQKHRLRGSPTPARGQRRRQPRLAASGIRPLCDEHQRSLFAHGAFVPQRADPMHARSSVFFAPCVVCLLREPSILAPCAHWLALFSSR